MTWRERWLPFLDLRGYSRPAFGKDLAAAASVTFLNVPQGIAYAMIAGLPPAMGLYATCVPTIVGALFRSSRHVVTGPSNALSLLVGTAGAAAAGLDPVPTALLLAFLVGAIQLAAGVLRLGVLVDYISIPVVVGYITGAALLIGIGQLHHLTGTPRPEGTLPERLFHWGSSIGDAKWLAFAVGVACAAAIAGLRRLSPRIPGAMIVLSGATFASWLFDFEAMGLRRIADVAPIPNGLPPLTLPGQAFELDAAVGLLPVAGAATVLSLVESSSVARALSAKTGQRLEISTEFVGQGLANLAAALTGGYPTSGSPSRSALNHQAGAVSRLAALLGGVLVVPVLLLMGPAIAFTPVAALAGLLLVVAVELVDRPRILKILRARRSDASALIVTVLGTLALRLDHAIYLGVAVSLVSYLRRARMLSVHRMVFDDHDRLLELPPEHPRVHSLACPQIRVVNVEGQLFFGAASELGDALDEVERDQAIRAVVLRLRHSRALDVTTVEVLESFAERLAARGRQLYIVGSGPQTTALLERASQSLSDDDRLYPHRAALPMFGATDAALRAALDQIGDHDCGDHCPVERHVVRADLAGGGVTEACATGGWRGGGRPGLPPRPSPRPSP